MDDLKNKVEEIVNKVKNDGDFAKKFQENPVQAVESVIGVDLPDDQINGVIIGTIVLIFLWYLMMQHSF